MMSGSHFGARIMTYLAVAAVCFIAGAFATIMFFAEDEIGLEDRQE
jgi:hypothetical protein